MLKLRVLKAQLEGIVRMLKHKQKSSFLLTRFGFIRHPAQFRHVISSCNGKKRNLPSGIFFFFLVRERGEKERPPYYSLILITDIYYKRNVKCVYSISLCNCVTPVALYANVQEFDVT